MTSILKKIQTLTPARCRASLIEVLLAASIFVIIALSLGELVVVLQRANIFSNERAAAFATASEKIEDLKLLTSANLLAQSGTTFPIERVIDGRVLTLPPDPASGRTKAGLVTVTPVANGNLYRVKVNVRLKSVNGPESIELLWAREFK